MTSVQERHLSGTRQLTAARTACTRLTEVQVSQTLTMNGGGAHRLTPLSEQLLMAVGVVGPQVGCP